MTDEFILFENLISIVSYCYYFKIHFIKKDIIITAGELE